MQFQLLILESIGTQELILVGLVALIVFGPRKLPQMARKFGKMMTELRKVSNDFRSTWEHEASIVESAFKMDDNEPRQPRTVGSSAAEENSKPVVSTEDSSVESLPSVRELSAEDMEKFTGSTKKEIMPSEETPPVDSEVPSRGKTDWL